MKKKFLKFILLLLAFISLPLVFTDNSQAASYNEKEMYRFVRRTMAKYHATGSVAVIKNGHVQRISLGYGYHGKRIGAGDSRMIYPACSLQKIITGAVIQQLIDEGKFNARTPISRWYPRIRNAKNITVEDLLTHTSGIHVTGTEKNRKKVYSEKAAINWVVNKVNARTVNKPGKFAYNNTNFILLAGIVEKETGKTYGQNVEERIIRPLGLSNTFMYNNIPGRKTRAISYTYRNRRDYQKARLATLALVSQLPGAANIYTTPTDYYKIMVGLTNGKILTQTQFDKLTSYKGRPNNYSGGVYIKRNGNLKMAYGNLAGTHYGNWVQLTRDNKNGIVMFLNQTQNSENRNKNLGYAILKHIKGNTFVNR